MSDSKRVDEIANTLYQKGLAASMWEARNKAMDILGISKKVIEQRDPSNFFTKYGQKEPQNNTLTFIMESAGITGKPEIKKDKVISEEKVKEFASKDVSFGKGAYFSDPMEDEKLIDNKHMEELKIEDKSAENKLEDNSSNEIKSDIAINPEAIKSTDQIVDIVIEENKGKMSADILIEQAMSPEFDDLQNLQNNKETKETEDDSTCKDTCSIDTSNVQTLESAEPAAEKEIEEMEQEISVIEQVEKEKLEEEKVSVPENIEPINSGEEEISKQIHQEKEIEPEIVSGKTITPQEKINEKPKIPEVSISSPAVSFESLNKEINENTIKPTVLPKTSLISMIKQKYEKRDLIEDDYPQVVEENNDDDSEEAVEKEFREESQEQKASPKVTVYTQDNVFSELDSNELLSEEDESNGKVNF